MKKLFMTMLTVLACGATYALPVGNPSDASLLCDGLVWEGYCGDLCDPCLTWCDAFNVRLGFYGDYVFNHHLKNKNKTGNDARITRTRLFTNAALLVANFWDRFDIFSTLGATRIRLESNASAWANANPGLRTTLETETHFSWSLGARGTIWECGCTSLGAEGQYFFTQPKIRRITLANTDTVNPGGVFDVKYREWQLGLGVSHRINLLVPYAAVRWGRSQLIFDDATFDFTTPDQWGSERFFSCKNSFDWGYAVGVSLVDCEKASLTVEARFVNENAVHVNGQLRF